MKYRITVASVIVLTCLVATLAPPVSAKRGPYVPPVVWDGLEESFREIVRRAHTVAIVEVTKSTVKPLGTRPPMYRTTVQFKNPVFLYGKAVPKAPTVVRGRQRLAPGTKVIIAWWKAEEGTVLISYSKANELATRRVLAPGWFVDVGLLCPSCRQRTFTADVGKCETCPGHTSSGMHKLCSKCARTAHQCQACKRTISAPTPDVTLTLNSGCPPTVRMGWLQMGPAKLTVLPGQPPRIEGLKPAIVLPGQSPKLVVGVWGGTKAWYIERGVYIHDLKNIPAVPELPCVNNDLATCTELFFLVTGPGIDGVEVVGFSARIIPTRADDEAKPKPLSLAEATSTFAELELVTLPDGKAFKQPGTYTVRAVAGRLMSNIHKVVVGEGAAVKDTKPGLTPEELELFVNPSTR